MSENSVALLGRDPRPPEWSHEVRQVSVLGPYNSGTNLMESYRRALFESPAPFGSVFFKHAIPPAYELGGGSAWARSAVSFDQVMQETLFLCMVRSPWTWVWSTDRRNYSVRSLAPASRERSFRRRMRSPIELWGRRYASPIEVWNETYRSYLGVLSARARVVFVRLEDLVLHPSEVLQDLGELVPALQGVDLEATIERIAGRPAKNHGGPCSFGDEARERARPDALSKLMPRSDLEWIEQQADPSIRKAFGYVLPPRSESVRRSVAPCEIVRGSTPDASPSRTPEDTWRPRRSPSVASWQDGPRTLLSSAFGRRTLALSELAASVWQLCDGEHDVEALMEALSNRTAASRASTRQAALEILEEFAEEGLLEHAEPEPEEETLCVDLRQVPCFVIHCADATRRRRMVERDLAELGLDWELVPGLRTRPKFVGVALSHLRVLRSPAARAPFLVLEDDAVSTSWFHPELEIPASAEALYLGVSTFGLPTPGLPGYGEAFATRWARHREGYLRVFNMLARHAVLYLSDDFRDRVIDSQLRCLTEQRPACPGDIGCAQLQLSHEVLTPDRPFFQQNLEPATWRGLQEALPRKGQSPPSPLVLDPRRLPQKPIFVGGCARSGTTLLTALLSAHPTVHVVGRGDWNRETHVLTRGGTPRDLRELARHLLEMPGSSTHWCEKSPLNVRFVSRILELFGEEARFVHVVRDGRDVVTSEHPAHPGRYYVQPHRWVEDVEAGRRSEQDPRVVTVRYEDLVADWQGEMEKLCESLGLPFASEILDFPSSATVRRSRAWTHPTIAPHTSSVGRWSEPRHTRVVDRLLALESAVELLSHYGYSRDDPPAASVGSSTSRR